MNEQAKAVGYVVRLMGVVQGTKYPDVEEAKKSAGGMLLSRRIDNKAEVLPIVPGAFGGLGEPIWTVKKSKSGVLSWAEHKAN